MTTPAATATTAAAAVQLAVVSRALGAVRIEGLSELSDGELLSLVTVSAEHVRLARGHSAVLAGEVARRSAPGLGHDGLAQRLGHRTPQKLLQATTGATARDAGQAVRVGGLSETHPWLSAVAAGVADGTMSTDAADAIRAGLGDPGDGVPAQVLADAAARLGEAPPVFCRSYAGCGSRLRVA